MDCLYEGMLPFHEHFRHSISQISALLTVLSPQSASKSKPTALNNLLYLTASLCRSLETHHTIEERFIFPTLAKKLPQFGKSSQHIKEHDQMHSALHTSKATWARWRANLRQAKAKDGWTKVYDHAKWRRWRRSSRILCCHIWLQRKRVSELSGQGGRIRAG